MITELKRKLLLRNIKCKNFASGNIIEFRLNKSDDSIIEQVKQESNWYFTGEVFESRIIESKNKPCWIVALSLFVDDSGDYKILGNMFFVVDRDPRTRAGLDLLNAQANKIIKEQVQFK